MADLESAQIFRNTKAPLLVGDEVKKAEDKRATALAELIAHRSGHES